MKLRVKNKFLSYEIGDELPISLLVSNPKYYTSQINQGNLEVITEVVVSPTLIKNLKNEPDKGIIARVKDYVEDLLDDGKRNYSNNPNKGRKLIKTKKKKVNKKK